jgi:NitT/TauT family transport system permease protein
MSEQPQRRRRSSELAIAAGLPIVGVAGVVALWWLVAVVFRIQTLLLPTPADVVGAFARLPGHLLRQTWVTLVETLEGFALALVAGLLIALALASSRVLARMFYPLLVAANAIPKLAIAPLLVVWLGFGRFPKVVMVFLVCFFPIVIATATGLTSTPTELAELFKSLSASPRQAFLKVRFPGALPHIFVGLKVAVGLAVIGATIAEFVGAEGGLGFVIIQAGSNADTPLAFAALSLLGIMSIVLFYAIVGVERLLLPWARATTG